MKKLMALILAMIMLVSFAGCGGEGGEKLPKDAVALTVDNYSMYFDLWTSCYGDGMPNGSIGFQISGPQGYGIDVGGSGTQLMFEGCIGTQVMTYNASTNFNYNNVVIEGSFKGTYGALDALSSDYEITRYDLEIPVTLRLKISGDGSAYGEVLNIYDDTNHLVTCDDLIDCEFVVTSVSGYVTPA